MTPRLAKTFALTLLLALVPKHNLAQSSAISYPITDAICGIEFNVSNVNAPNVVGDPSGDVIFRWSYIGGGFTISTCYPEAFDTTLRLFADSGLTQEIQQLAFDDNVHCQEYAHTSEIRNYALINDPTADGPVYDGALQPGTYYVVLEGKDDVEGITPLLFACEFDSTRSLEFTRDACFEPVVGSRYSDGNVTLAENFEVSFTWYPGEDIDDELGELFRIAVNYDINDDGSSPIRADTRNLAVFTVADDATRLHVVVGNRGSDDNRGCVLAPIEDSIREVVIRVLGRELTVEVNDVRRCTLAFFAERYAISAPVLTSNGTHAGAVGRVCNLTITTLERVKLTPAPTVTVTQAPSIYTEPPASLDVTADSDGDRPLTVSQTTAGIIGGSTAAFALVCVASCMYLIGTGKFDPRFRDRIAERAELKSRHAGQTRGSSADQPGGTSADHDDQRDGKDVHDARRSSRDSLDRRRSRSQIEGEQAVDVPERHEGQSYSHDVKRAPAPMQLRNEVDLSRRREMLEIDNDDDEDSLSGLVFIDPIDNEADESEQDSEANDDLFSQDSDHFDDQLSESDRVDGQTTHVSFPGEVPILEDIDSNDDRHEEPLEPPPGYHSDSGGEGV